MCQSSIGQDRSDNKVISTQFRVKAPGNGTMTLPFPTRGYRVEAPITDYLRNVVLDLEKYKVVQFFSHVDRN
jgi:hypothetical protein